jgi:polysaccharide pyruvyl transferase WcaK-like protein
MSMETNRRKSAPGIGTPEQPLASQDSETSSILLMGFYGRGNFGDDLMCTALAGHLVDAGYAVNVASSAPDAFSGLKAKGVTVIPRSLRNVIRALSTTTILCQGGGTNFHDSYQGRYLLRQWLNLWMWTMLFWIARIMGVQVIILGAGMGPLRHPVSRWITRMACAACTAIGVRDRASIDELRRLGTNTYFELGFDLAALTGIGSEQRVPRPDYSEVLGVSACSLTPFLGDPQQNRDYWERMGDALALFVRSRPVRVVFFSLFTGSSSESDDAIIDVIAARMPEGAALERHSYCGDVESYSSLFNQCDWFLGTKYHAALSAYLAGRPCAVISYNRKMTDLAEEIRLPLSWRVSADKVQPLLKWLNVLESLTGNGITGIVLARSAARQRACETVARVLARTNQSGHSAARFEHGR